MRKTNRPDIYRYDDAIRFLEDWLSYRKKNESDFNLRAFSKSCGIALGAVSMMLSRKRVLSEKAFQKMSPHLGLGKEEIRFLDLLRIVGTSDIPKARLDAAEAMMGFKKYRNLNSKDSRTFEYLTKWYFVTIYEMFSLQNFQFNVDWIRKTIRYKLSADEVQKALDFLVDHKFVVKSTDGSWSQSVQHLDCTEGIYKISLCEFHKQMLDLAEDALHSVPREDRLFMGQTMAVSGKNVEEIKRIIRRAIDEINAVNLDVPDREEVFHVEIAAFPLLKKLEKEVV